MTFADWLIMVERSGVPVSGVDPNWLQHQFQMQQQPALVAHMIQTGQAPRMMTSGMGMGYGVPKRSGCSSPLIQVLVGILGFVGLVVGILYGIKYFADNKLGGLKTNTAVAPPNDTPQATKEVLIAKGLKPDAYYPYWPLVYDQQGMAATKEAITGKIKNYGDKEVTSVTVQFGLFSKAEEKIGTAKDEIANLGPGEIWDYKASVQGVNFDQCRIESITFK